MATHLHAQAYPPSGARILRSGARILRILVTRRLHGSIDGIRLDRFHPGGVYDVGVTIGSYLLAVGAAEPVDDDVPATTPAPERQMFGPVVKKGCTVARFPRDRAADRRRKKSPKRG